MIERLARAPLTVPALAGAAIAVLVAPLLTLLKPLFHVPDHGIGWVTVNHYPKSWDYAVVVMLFAIAAIATLATALAMRSAAIPPIAASVVDRRPKLCVALMLLATIAVLPARDQPYEFADPYHEGETLSPASVMMSGGHPYGDVWFMHGVGVDGGIDLLVLPNVVHARRLHAFLSAATVSLIVPIAAEICATWTGAIAATIASLFAIAAGQLPATPHLRFLPLLLAVWLALIAIRTNKRVYRVAACAIASAGLLWSLDVGLFALAGIWLWMIVTRRVDVFAALATVVTPLLILVAMRGDIARWFRDSFLRLPECFDAIYSLAAPPIAFTGASIRYYVPPILYGVTIAVAILIGARGDARRANAMFVVTFVALVEFRTAAGRASWGHTRFSMPLLGIIAVGFVIEPLLRSRRAPQIGLGALLAIAAIFYFEAAANITLLAQQWSTYRERLQPKPGSVRFPIPRARDLYTYAEEAHDIGALYEFSLSMPAGPIFDYSGEKYLYYMLARPSSTRVHDIPYLSDPSLEREAMNELERRRPVFVVVSGHPALAQIDGVSNAQRTPEIAQWIDRRYAKRITIGRYTIGLPSTSR